MSIGSGDIDPVELGVCWDRLVSIANEQSAVMINSSFSAVLGDMEDLSAGVFDPDGVMLAQSVTGAPGHLGSLSPGIKHLLATFPEGSLVPGDVLVTNDPWLVSGHKNDVTVATPAFAGGRLVGFAASNCHTVDIGGRIHSAAAHEVYEEGLQIPRLKLFERGQRNDTLFRIIEENVRSPQLVIGDLLAQVSANETAVRHMTDLLREHAMADLRPLARAMVQRTEAMMRKAIRAVPDGCYRDSVELDGHEQRLRIAVAVSIAGDGAVVEFEDVPAQVPMGINCVLNFTKAISHYAMKCLLAPESPNNDGSFRPIEVRAPSGSILNATHPAPVGARHLVGLYIPFAIFGAMKEVLPERVLADSSVLSAITIAGRNDADAPFVFTFFSHGGTGARANKDGLSATAFPSNVANVPVEIMERSTPVLVTRRELVPGSFGGGRHRGGAGQRVGMRLLASRPALVSCMVERTLSAPRGFFGGAAGRPARLLLDGRAFDPKRSFMLQPGQELVLETSGGGGYGHAAQRVGGAVEADRIAGLLGDG